MGERFPSQQRGQEISASSLHIFLGGGSKYNCSGLLWAEHNITLRYIISLPFPCTPYLFPRPAQPSLGTQKPGGRWEKGNSHQLRPAAANSSGSSAAVSHLLHCSAGAFAREPPPNSRGTGSEPAAGEFNCSLQNASSRGLLGPSHTTPVTSLQLCQAALPRPVPGKQHREQCPSHGQVHPQIFFAFFSHPSLTCCPACFSEVVPGRRASGSK